MSSARDEPTPGRQVARAAVRGEVAVGPESELVVGATVTFEASDRPVDVVVRIPGVCGRDPATTITCELVDGGSDVLDTAVFVADSTTDRASLHLEDQVHPGAGEVVRRLRVKATGGSAVLNDAGLSTIIVKAIER